MIYRMRADNIRPYNYMVFFQVSHYFVSDCSVNLPISYGIFRRIML